MSKKSALLKRFRHYWGGPTTTVEELTAELADIANETDRSLVVLSATRIEDALKQKLLDALPRMTNKLEMALFDIMKPISTFSSKIDLGEALGVVDSYFAKRLHTLREMRNGCAHSSKHISFQTPVLEEVSRTLTPTEIIYLFPDEKRSPEGERQHFIWISSYFWRCLLETKSKAETEIRKYYEIELHRDGSAT